MSKRRLPDVPNGAFWIAAESHRPRFTTNHLIHWRATKAFYDVAELLLSELNEHHYSDKAKMRVRLLPDYGAFYPRGWGAKMHISSAREYSAMNELFLAMREAIEEAHKSGVEFGRSLLSGLASGELTVGEFNNLSLKSPDAK